MKMISKIYNFAFPMTGGSIGAITQANQVSEVLQWGPLLSTAILALVGAVVGILVNECWKFIKRRLKKA
jgi:H+/Cl- antiporter ClcA